MAGVVRVHETGGPEVLRFEQVEVGAPGPRPGSGSGRRPSD